MYVSKGSTTKTKLIDSIFLVLTCFFTPFTEEVKEDQRKTVSSHATQELVCVSLEQLHVHSWVQFRNVLIACCRSFLAGSVLCYDFLLSKKQLNLAFEPSAQTEISIGLRKWKFCCLYCWQVCWNKWMWGQANANNSEILTWHKCQFSSRLDWLATRVSNPVQTETETKLFYCLRPDTG